MARGKLRQRPNAGVALEGNGEFHPAVSRLKDDLRTGLYPVDSRLMHNICIMIWAPCSVTCAQSCRRTPGVDEAQVGRSGPCGYNARMSTDYNQPGASWGTETAAAYATGQTVEAQWCVDRNGDHGVMFAYRVYRDQALVDKFLDPGGYPDCGARDQACYI
ncbi:hypothetical protein F5Y05DRAFT_410605 [Hypoxylon sp. FL0543]|nr:hypothetical protein F5Y05DRAFT_410605 [Hypoxylon sp. FL0543]